MHNCGSQVSDVAHGPLVFNIIALILCKYNLRNIKSLIHVLIGGGGMIRKRLQRRFENVSKHYISGFTCRTSKFTPYNIIYLSVIFKELKKVVHIRVYESDRFVSYSILFTDTIFADCPIAKILLGKLSILRDTKLIANMRKNKILYV